MTKNEITKYRDKTRMYLGGETTRFEKKRRDAAFSRGPARMQCAHNEQQVVASTV